MTIAERRTNRITRDEILDLGDYERRRDDVRASAIRARRERRVFLGPNATLSFENRETVRYQIQEMLRAERIAKPEEVDHEIETYSDLLPTDSELSATLMLEFPDDRVRLEKLTALRDIESHLYLAIDDAANAVAQFDRSQIGEDRLSSVQFIRFPLTPAQRDALRKGGKLSVVCDHPAYPHAVEVDAASARAIASDLES
ncbi:MAG TPA: DUF3501 family protein [Thermoanaerobaculia bacterium]|jgi:hypothetical protein|nr:DUF3501 family protein [Thermoanaerobaculia bacterium]